MSTPESYTEAEAHRLFAQECNQHVWALVAKPDRTIFTSDLVGGNWYGIR